MEIVYNKTEAEERVFVQKLVDTAWPFLNPVVGQVLRPLYMQMGTAKR